MSKRKGDSLKNDPIAELGLQGWHWQKGGQKTPVSQKVMWAVLGAMIAGNIAIMVINTQHMTVSREQSPARNIDLAWQYPKEGRQVVCKDCGEISTMDCPHRCKSTPCDHGFYGEKHKLNCPRYLIEDFKQ